ncbi:oxygen-regulated protein 1-like [Xyrichtys novacula]|uniref:Oxygen-regulated protein 1-like n=1 Tax=Xyrichtys novacula TaxID=13765 RepID=A0AAV1H901_XYRNO|nr:oxygen-regulated protein 1-like [Xyrichtys novacula]
MMNETGLRRVLPGQSSGSAHTFGTPRHPSVIDPILSKRVCFYKSGDPQFNGLRMVINNRTFKTFDALLDSLSKKVPLPFGVRNITTPHGVHAVSTLDDLEDGKSYICSDSHRVKPFNLARAKKKLPPWYHARPASSRRRTVKQARLFPGQNKKEPVVLRTPKKLLVFRNGDPSVKHVVGLSKRTTSTFESILEYISEQIQFHVVKLLTPDGKRVDGLPGLILSSGTVVAAGREPYKPANYGVQKSPAQTTLPTNRKSVRRLKALNRKKKSPSNGSKSRPFSPSSERFIVNQIHNSIAESSSELRSYPSNSVDWEPGHMLESVAETEAETCLGDGVEGQGCLVPTDDDIEKSFRVNQDGSMTVEMKVRLTLKEEETIHWTTTLTRSSVGNLLNENSLPPPEEEELSSQRLLDFQSPVASIDSINKDKTKDNDDDNPPTSCTGAPSEGGIEEDNNKAPSQIDLVSPKRTPTPSHEQIRTKQTSMESVKSVTADGIQEDVVGSYSYREQTKHGAMTEQYCLVKQSSTRPVPKPRRLGSLDTNSISSRNVSSFKSSEMSEVLKVESSGEEVTETVLHIYEQQTCQDNYLANFCAQGTAAPGIPFGRPATSETRLFTPNNESEPDLWRPSTASESISLWRAGSASITSDLTLPLLNTGSAPERNAQRGFPEPSKGIGKSQQTDAKNRKAASIKPKLLKKRVHRLVTPKKRQKNNSSGATEIRKKVKTFSSAGFLRKIYGTKSKSKTTMKVKKGQQTSNKGLTSKSSQQSDETIKNVLKDPERPLVLNEIKMETERSKLNIATKEICQPRGILTRQASMYQERRTENESYDISKSMSMPAFNSSSAFTNEYVENWLEKAQFEAKTYRYEESKKAEKEIVQKEKAMSIQSENKNSPVTEAKEAKCLENTSQTETNKTLQVDQQPENVRRSSVKQRIQSFENKVSPSPERSRISQETVTVHQNPPNTESYITLAQNDATLSATKTPSKTPVKISLQNLTPSITLSMDFPPPPSPPAETVELSNNEYCEMDESSPASSPLYRMSSVSSQMSDNHPQSASPSSEKAASPTDLTMERATPVRTCIPPSVGEAPLPRSPSIKRAPLVSNLSFGRTMALRKASMDKYALSSDPTPETTGNNIMRNDIHPTSTQLQSEISQEQMQLSNSMVDSKSSHSYYTSASPNSLTSEDRVQSPSVLSGDQHIKETNTSQTEIPSPKTPARKVQLISSPSPERKSPTKTLSPEVSHKSPKLPSIKNHHSEKTTSPNTGKQRHASPSTEKKLQHQKPKLQKTLSPYSQSLDLVSPPIRRKSSKKLLSRNHSSEDASDSSHGAPKKTSSLRKNSPTTATETDKSLSSNTNKSVEVNQSDDSMGYKTDDLTSGQENSMAETGTIAQPLNISNQPDIKSVLEDICYSIKSIRLITQNKRPSCLERSNSLPDFSSHVASTFGSSSKALLAFLAVMTLKEGLTNQNVDELNANNVSCAEALKMIDSLKEIASIEDSHKLKDRLSKLQQSASKQLLQSWKGFQELGDKCKSRSSTPDDSEHEFCPAKDGSIDENVDEIMGNLDVPEKLKEELASLSADFKINDSEKICAKITEKVEPAPNGDFYTKLTHSSTEGAVPVKEVSQDVKANVNVGSIIKQFSNIETTKTIHVEEKVKRKPPVQPNQDKNSHHRQNNVTVSPPPEPEVRPLYSTDLLREEKIEDVKLCGQNEEEQQHNSRESSENEANMNVISRDENVEQDTCAPEVKVQDMVNNHVQMQSKVQGEESISVPGHEPTRVNESASEQEEGQNMLSANTNSGGSSDGGSSCSDADDGHGLDEEAAAECEERRESEDLSKPESHSEDEEDQQLRSTTEDTLSNSVSPSNLEKEQHSMAGYMGLRVSVDESMHNSDEDEAYSEGEQQEAECEDVKEDDDDDEEGQESMVEEEYADDFLDDREQTEVGKSLKDLVEEAEDKISLKDEDYLVDEGQICEKTRSLSTIDDLGNSYNMTDNGSLVKPDSLEKRDTFRADEDSGNDHSNCDEHTQIQKTSQKDEQMNNSNEELSYFGKASDSEEDHKVTDIQLEETGEMKCQQAVEKPQHQSEQIISQTVAERVILLEKQVSDNHKKNNTAENSPKRSFSQRNIPLEVDFEKTQSETGSRSAPQSSLSFSYDSSSVITTEPEGNRVRSIREMFLAKGATDTPQGDKPLPSPNSSGPAEFRAQTSTSAGYESQTSSEPSSGEDDSPRKSISKGFVRRTIERLYGMRNANYDEQTDERPPSVPKEKKKENSSFFSPFHVTQTKAMPELSYFNSTSALENLTEATRCMAFNAKVMPGHSVPVSSEQLLFSENTHIRKSVSDPVGINKSFTDSPQGEGLYKDTEKNASFPLSSKKSELEDRAQSFTRKCTYFSLPHGSDSDACQDELSIVSKGSANGDNIMDLKDNSEDTQTPAEKNGTLPGISVTDFKKMDNKVHPLVELPQDGGVVVVQPGKGQGVMNRRLQDPDMLDMLYDFCGQNCPIL